MIQFVDRANFARSQLEVQLIQMRRYSHSSIFLWDGFSTTYNLQSSASLSTNYSKDTEIRKTNLDTTHKKANREYYESFIDIIGYRSCF